MACRSAMMWFFACLLLVLAYTIFIYRDSTRYSFPLLELSGGLACAAMQRKKEWLICFSFHRV